MIDGPGADEQSTEWVCLCVCVFVYHSFWCGSFFALGQLEDILLSNLFQPVIMLCIYICMCVCSVKLCSETHADRNHVSLCVCNSRVGFCCLCVNVVGFFFFGFFFSEWLHSQWHGWPLVMGLLQADCWGDHTQHTLTHSLTVIIWPLEGGEAMCLLLTPTHSANYTPGQSVPLALQLD